MRGSLADRWWSQEIGREDYCDILKRHLAGIALADDLAEQPSQTLVYALIDFGQLMGEGGYMRKSVCMYMYRRATVWGKMLARTHLRVCSDWQ